MKRIAAVLVACVVLFSCVPTDAIDFEEETEMPRVTPLPEWASSPPAGAIVEPAAEQKEAGWSAGQRPPSQFFNWWMENVYRHLEYLDARLHGEYEVWIPASAFHGEIDNAQASGAFSDDEWRSITSASYEIEAPLSGLGGLRVGDRIKSITLYGRDGNVGGETYTGRLRRSDTAGAATNWSSDKTGGTTGADSSLAWTVADTGFDVDDGHMVVAGFYWLQALIEQTSGAAEVRIFGAKIIVDRPEL